MLAALELRLSLAARRLVFGLVAGCLFLIGLAFLTVSAWLAIAAAQGHALAALWMGLAYIVIGLVLLLFARLRTPRPVVAPAPAPAASLSAATLPILVEAFVIGLQAARRRRPRRSRDPRDD